MRFLGQIRIPPGTKRILVRLAETPGPPPAGSATDLVFTPEQLKAFAVPSRATPGARNRPGTGAPPPLADHARP